VSATYAGDANYNATSSSSSTSIVGPTVTAKLKSKHAISHGWYRGPVTIRFSCAAGSAPLDTACPGPIKLTASRAGQTRTVPIGDTDGGLTTLTVGPINIDRKAPKLHVAGATSGHTYASRRTLRCVAQDGLSGTRSCHLMVEVGHRRHGRQVVNYSAV